MLSKCSIIFGLIHMIYANMENSYFDYLYSEEKMSTIKPTTGNSRITTSLSSGSGRALYRSGKRKGRTSGSMDLLNPLFTSKSPKSRLLTPTTSSWEIHNPDKKDVLNPLKGDISMPTIDPNHFIQNLTELEDEGIDIIENEFEDGIGAEPIDGPKSPPRHDPAELIRRSYQPFFICAKNSKEGIRNCRLTCDIRNRQIVTCLGKFCYCQTSYNFLKANAYDPTVKVPFFHCGTYDLEGYEKCIERCRREPKATVQCGGNNCFCHYAAIGPFESDSLTNSAEVLPKPNHIRAAYCGRAPKINNGIRYSSLEIRGTKINMCEYRCPDGKYACDLIFCYCS